MTFLNSNPDSEENKQFVLDFDSDRGDRDSETENHSCPNSNTRRTEISPVPDSLALAPNRFYLWRVENGDRWHIPIQLSMLEGWLILPLVCRERDREAIFRIVESQVALLKPMFVAEVAS